MGGYIGVPVRGYGRGWEAHTPPRIAWWRGLEWGLLRILPISDHGLPRRQIPSRWFSTGGNEGGLQGKWRWPWDKWGLGMKLGYFILWCNRPGSLMPLCGKLQILCKKLLIQYELSIFTTSFTSFYFVLVWLLLLLYFIFLKLIFLPAIVHRNIFASFFGDWLEFSFWFNMFIV